MLDFATDLAYEYESTTPRCNAQPPVVMSPVDRAKGTLKSRRAIGERLAELRDASHLSTARVGEAVGVSGTQVQKWEAGDGEPNEADVERLAHLYGMTPARLRYGQSADVLASEVFLEGRATLAREVKSFIDARLTAGADARTWPNTGDPEEPLPPIPTISPEDAAELERRTMEIVAANRAERASRKKKG